MRIILFLIFSPLIIFSQSIRINEVVSSNSVYFDEDGDSPDWIELYNYGNQTISLDSWTISDNIENLDMWTFPQINLDPDEYLLIWASGKNRSQISYSRTYINQGDVYKYIIPNSEPNLNWNNINFMTTAGLMERVVLVMLMEMTQQYYQMELYLCTCEKVLQYQI